MPLVDVMLVLLIIFMVTAPMIQRGIDVSLPVATRASQISGERVYVTVRQDFQQKQTVYLGTDEIRVERAQERIRQRMEASADKKVYLRGDRGVMYEDLMDVIDVLKAAGVVDVGLVTESRSAADWNHGSHRRPARSHARAGRASADGRRVDRCFMASIAAFLVLAPGGWLSHGWRRPAR